MSITYALCGGKKNRGQQKNNSPGESCQLTTLAMQPPRRHRHSRLLPLLLLLLGLLGGASLVGALKGYFGRTEDTGLGSPFASEKVLDAVDLNGFVCLLFSPSFVSSSFPSTACLCVHLC
jgi:hypothetical protein